VEQSDKSLRVPVPLPGAYKRSVAELEIINIESGGYVAYPHANGTSENLLQQLKGLC